MRRDVFYKSLRRRNSGVFGTSLSQKQVDGCEAILNACIAEGADLAQAAYILATGYGETGGKMQPVRENLNYRASAIAKHFGAHRRQGYSCAQLARNPQLLGNIVYGGPWGLKNLGNIRKNDGYTFRGWGIGQWTGRRNTEKVGSEIGVDLISDPSKLDDINVNAQLLVRWMLGGKATGKKLADYVSHSRRDYLGARKVWGGVNAAKYAKFSKSFELALSEARYTAAPPAPAKPDPAEQPPKGLAGLFLAIINAFRR